MGIITTIIPIAAKLIFPVLFRTKKSGTPISAPAPKQSSCLFVRFMNTLVFTLDKSLGTEINAAIGFHLIS